MTGGQDLPVPPVDRRRLLSGAPSRMELTPVECGADSFKVTKIGRDGPGRRARPTRKVSATPRLKLTYCAADQ